MLRLGRFRFLLVVATQMAASAASASPPNLSFIPEISAAAPTDPTSAPTVVAVPSVRQSSGDAALAPVSPSTVALDSWLDRVQVGYDDAFVIAARQGAIATGKSRPFVLKLNGWGQIRHTNFESDGPNRDLNQFQLKRARLLFSGTAFNPDVFYLVQLDGRSSSGDQMRLLDYELRFDVGHYLWGFAPGTLGFRTGKYKMPFHFARSVSGKHLEMTDRSMASTFFDVNRSLAWGLYGRHERGWVPMQWETAIFNGLVSGGSETGSSGTLDNNFGFSARIDAFPCGDWGTLELADFSYHESLATRIGIGFAFSEIDRIGSTEFSALRVVDSGEQLSSILPAAVTTYQVALLAASASLKYRGLSVTTEYYLRSIGEFDYAPIPDLFDHGFWLQTGLFVIPEKLEIVGRWSRVAGSSGTLGVSNQASEEIAGGLMWYINGQHFKLAADVTHLDGAPINSTALDIAPGDIGWLFRTQFQFSF